MEIINLVERMTLLARERREHGQTVGLVPTMGALHEGHLSLMTRAREMCDTVIASVFVNPTQFGPGEDLDRYPRDLARDAESARTRGVHFLFAPSADEMYPAGFSTYTVVDGLSDKLEGASRPGHFRGVTTVVNKLLNIVNPHFAFFGHKDAQQAIVIKKMVRELGMWPRVIVCPTMRQPDGLALSSRNRYLSAEERKAATVLRRALELCRSMYNAGDRDSGKLASSMRSMIEGEPRASVDYIAITDTERLEPLDNVSSDRPALVSMAVFIGATRLIDNIVLNGALD